MSRSGTTGAGHGPAPRPFAVALVALLLMAAAGCGGDDQERPTLPDGAAAVVAGSVIGQSLWAVNPKTGKARVVIPPPEGMADDLGFGPGNQMVWTAISAGIGRDLARRSAWRRFRSDDGVYRGATYSCYRRIHGLRTRRLHRDGAVR